MKLTTSKLAMDTSAMLYLKKLKYSLVLFLMTLPFLLNAQENEAELPETFFGTWVEDISECNGGDGYRIDITDSEGGLLVSGLDWYSTEVVVTTQEDYYTLTINGVSEEGEFETELSLKMDEDGYLIKINSDTEEFKFVKCDLIIIEEFEDSGLEVEEFDMVEGTLILESFDSELPLYFYGEWVEDLAQCEVASILSIVASEEGLVVSGYEWSANEVKVENNGDFYTLLIKGSSADGDFETQIKIRMGEDGTLIYAYPESDETQLVNCNLEGDGEFVDVEFVEVEMDELELVDTVLAVEEFDMVQIDGLQSINLELLQGTWQSLEDEASFLVIEGDRMKNYYGGMGDELDNEVFIISDTCMNESDSVSDLPEEKDRYLSNPNLDMCWYIESVDATNLTLIYTARGNTLTYRRVE
jgi:hypothetical protein